jgi:hypothetical protein
MSNDDNEQDDTSVGYNPSPTSLPLRDKTPLQFAVGSGGAIRANKHIDTMSPIEKAVLRQKMVESQNKDNPPAPTKPQDSTQKDPQQQQQMQQRVKAISSIQDPQAKADAMRSVISDYGSKSDLQDYDKAQGVIQNSNLHNTAHYYNKDDSTEADNHQYVGGRLAKSMQVHSQYQQGLGLSVKQGKLTPQQAVDLSNAHVSDIASEVDQTTGAIANNTGGATKLSAPAQTKSEEYQQSKQRTLDGIAEIRKNFYPEALTLGNQLKGKVAEGMSKLGLESDDQKDLLDKRERFMRPIYEIQDNIVHDLAGARGMASPAIIQRIVGQSIGGNMDPNTFHSALDSLEKGVRRDYATAGAQQGGIPKTASVGDDGSDQPTAPTTGTQTAQPSANTKYVVPEDVLHAHAKAQGWI